MFGQYLRLIWFGRCSSEAVTRVDLLASRCLISNLETLTVPRTVYAWLARDARKSKVSAAGEVRVSMFAKELEVESREKNWKEFL